MKVHSCLCVAASFLSAAIGASLCNAAITNVMPFDPFTGPSVPVNRAGNDYPDEYNGELNLVDGGGAATVTLDTAPTGLPVGNSVDFNVTSGNFYAEFNPYNAVGRTFASNYSANPSQWLDNTYTNLSFWINVPTTGSPMTTNGDTNTDVGTYVKSVSLSDPYSDEDGGNHYYHSLNSQDGNLDQGHPQRPPQPLSWRAGQRRPRRSDKSHWRSGL